MGYAITGLVLGDLSASELLQHLRWRTLL